MTEFLREQSLEEILARLHTRDQCEVFTGLIIQDRNFESRILVVSDATIFYSIDRSDVVDVQIDANSVQRVWVRRGATIWRSIRVSGSAGEEQFPPLAIETFQAPPPVHLLAGDPDEGTADDQQKLKADATIEGAAKLFKRGCDGGDIQSNNCAHFLSNAFISAGFADLAKPHDCVEARCGTPAKRPIKARNMWCWFKSRAAKSGRNVQKNTGFWAVFQLNEAQYWGGHVVIIDSNSWKYYGTGWYGDWEQYSYQW